MNTQIMFLDVTFWGKGEGETVHPRACGVGGGGRRLGGVPQEKKEGKEKRTG